MSVAPGVVPGFTPGVVSGFTPGVVSGLTPGVVSGFTPGVVSGFTPGVVPSSTTSPVPGSAPVAVQSVTPGVPISTSTPANTVQTNSGQPTSHPTTTALSSVSISSASSHSASSSSSPSTSVASHSIHSISTTESSTSVPATSNTKTFPSSTAISTTSDSKTTPSATSVLPSSSTSTTAPLTFRNKNAVIIGGVVGGVVGILIITALLMYYLIRRSRRDRKRVHDHVTAFEVFPDESLEPTSRLQAGPHPPASKPNVSDTNPSSVSDSSLTYPIRVDAQPERNVVETTNQSAPSIGVPQEDPVTDRSICHPNLFSPALIRPNPNLPVMTSSDLNPLLQDMFTTTRGRNQVSLDPRGPNISQNIQIFILDKPSNANGSVPNKNRENGGDHNSQSSLRYVIMDMPDIDTLSLPPSYK